jgi:hypothetical protein
MAICVATPAVRADDITDAWRISIVDGPDMLVANGPDLALPLSKAPGHIDEAVIDPAQDLVWYTSKRTLYVVDLRTAALKKPIAIARRMPPGPFAVSGLSEASTDVSAAGVYPTVVLGAKATIQSVEGPQVGHDAVADRKTRKAIKKISIVGKKWLKSQRGRVPRNVSGMPSGTAPPEAELRDIGWVDHEVLQPWAP